MNRLIIVLSCIFLFFSCDAPEENLEFQVPHVLSGCVVESVDATSNFTCEDIELDTSVHCEKIHIDEDLNLTDQDVSWMPGFCCELGDQLFYENEDGERIFLTLDEKIFEPSVLLVSNDTECSDPSKRTLYCGESQMVELQFSSSHLPHPLSINLNKRIQLSNGEILKGARLVAFFSTQSTVFPFEIILEAFVEPGNLELDYDFEFHEEIEILGQTFNNVYSTPMLFQEPFTLFYNQSAGIVAFIDQVGRTWRIIM